MVKVPQIPLKQTPEVDPEAAEKWAKMREHYRATYFQAYLVYLDAVGSAKIIMVNDFPLSALDNLDAYVKTKYPGLQMLIDWTSTEILWATEGTVVKTGDTFEMIHEMWGKLSGEPRYYATSDPNKVVDNYQGGRIVDRF